MYLKYSDLIQDISLNELNDIISKNLKIGIWGGGTPLFNSIVQYIKYINPSFSNLTVWDTYKHGMKLFRNKLTIERPDFKKISLEQYSCIILTFTKDEHFDSCAKILLENNYERIVNGFHFLKQLTENKFDNDLKTYEKLNTDTDFLVLNDNLRRGYSDFYDTAGSNFNTPYLVQDLWAAKKIFEKKPPKHYDIGSRVDGFITHLLSFNMPTVLIDIRRLETFGIENLSFINEDATTLTCIQENSVESLSALCSLEHFGLGRYGDPIDPDAHRKVFKNIQNVLKQDGDLYISVPVSKNCSLYFNQYRIYSPQYILNEFDKMELVEFSYTSESGLVANAAIDSIEDYEDAVTSGVFGLFHLRKTVSI